MNQVLYSRVLFSNQLPCTSRTVLLNTIFVFELHFNTMRTVFITGANAKNFGIKYGEQHPNMCQLNMFI